MIEFIKYMIFVTSIFAIFSFIFAYIYLCEFHLSEIDWKIDIFILQYKNTYLYNVLLLNPY